MTQKIEYHFPVSQLLELGQCDWRKIQEDYIGLGITKEHIPELIRMATDEYLLKGEDLVSEEYAWAVVHACRALGRLQATEAISTLINMLGFIDSMDEDWIISHMPTVFASMGKQAVPALKNYILNTDNALMPRITALSSITAIGKSDNDVKQECIDFLRSLLQDYQNNDIDINTHCISDLADFKDKDSGVLIKEVFDNGYAEECFAGDWQDVYISMGLMTERISPRKKFSYFNSMTNSLSNEEKQRNRQQRNRKEKIRKLNKQARKSRKNQLKPHC